MTHEEMIEEARKAVHAVIPGAGPYDSWPPATGLGLDFLGDIARAVLAVFEKAQAPTEQRVDKMAEVHPDAWLDFNKHRFAPTDGERDASCGSYADQEGISLVLLKLREAYYPQGLEALSCDSIAFAITAAGFRRPAQAPADDEREVLAQVISDSVGGWSKDTAAITNTRDAILAAGFRRPAQAEPTGQE